MLEVFTMDGSPNHIEGTIPTTFGNLTYLTVLDLDENGLTGTIPEELYSSTSFLQQLDLDSNFLTGTISENVGDLGSLTFLQLHNNSLTGEIPKSMNNLQDICKFIPFYMCCGNDVPHL